MEFVVFPLHIGAEGWIDRSSIAEESILSLFRVMATTPSNGWCGSAEFGLRDTLAELQSKHGARLVAIKQINKALLDLGVDWVKVESIASELVGDSGRLSYSVTLLYIGKGTEVHRIQG